jgi:hypothetical protein
MKRLLGLAFVVAVGAVVGWVFRDLPISVFVGAATGLLWGCFYLLAADLGEMIRDLRRRLRVDPPSDIETERRDYDHPTP